MSPKGDTDPEPCEKEVQRFLSIFEHYYVEIGPLLYGLLTYHHCSASSAILILLHCLTPLRAVALSQAQLTRAVHPLTTAAVM